MGILHRNFGDSDYALHPPAFISATDPEGAAGVGATGLRSGQWWIEHGVGDADDLEALWYRNAANDGWVDILGSIAGVQNPSSIATGDIVYGSASNTLSALAAGTNGQVLTLAAGIPSWATPTDYGVANPGTVTTGDVLYASASDTISALAIGTEDQVLTVSAGGIPEWADSAGGSGLSNPGTMAQGSIIYASAADTLAELTAGTNGYVLTMGASVPAWADPGIANPSTATTGDIIYASGSNTLAALGIGTSGQVLTVSAGGIPEWAAGGGGGGYGDGDTIKAADGSVAAPGLTFNNETDSGFASTANNRIACVVNGTEVMRLQDASFIQRVTITTSLELPSGTAGSPSLWQASTTNTGIFFPGSQKVGISTGGNERFRVESDGGILMYNLPASDPGVTGELWDNAGVVNISA